MSSIDTETPPQQQSSSTPPPERDSSTPRDEEVVELEQEAALERLEDERRRLAEEWELCLQDPYRASPESKYQRYAVAVDHEAGDRATEIRLGSFARPHMRGLHAAWISFFLAFTIWFAPAPLLREIKDTLKLSKSEVWTSSITNDLTAIVMRVFMGPICDAFAARIPMAAVLVLGAIPTAMVGLVQNATGLAIVRFFIGIAGSSFVMAQFWPIRMFAREIAGTANGLGKFCCGLYIYSYDEHFLTIIFFKITFII